MVIFVYPHFVFIFNHFCREFLCFFGTQPVSLGFIRNHVPTQNVKIVSKRFKQVYMKHCQKACGALLYQCSPSRAGQTDVMDGPAAWATDIKKHHL